MSAAEEEWSLTDEDLPMVYVNVYDVSDVGLDCLDVSSALALVNKQTLGMWDMGFFHAGVEILDVEYSFGSCDIGTGVYACDPRSAAGASFRTTLKMGRTPLTSRAIDTKLATFASTWTGSSYSLIHKNCCHFCESLCEALEVAKLPSWVNALAASAAQILKPQPSWFSTYIAGVLTTPSVEKNDLEEDDDKGGFSELGLTPSSSSASQDSHDPSSSSSSSPLWSTSRSSSQLTVSRFLLEDRSSADHDDSTAVPSPGIVS